MYRPPENCNRVKSIKSKFENVEKKSEPNYKSKGLTQNLSRQLSDPSRKNIKRTPAFRIDVNSVNGEKKSFERSAACNRSFYFERIQQYNTALKNGDNNKNVMKTENDCVPKSENVKVLKEISKPALIKAKSSLDFTSLRNKFEVHESPITTKTPVIQHDKIVNKNDISVSYTKPIPKELRTKPKEEKLEVEPNNNDRGLTDTLKAALKRPLPDGPAPQKPPRTFEHNPVTDTSKNISFLHHHRRKEEVKPTKPEYKHDPRYMLNKLEHALRNHKIRMKKHDRLEASTTSGEDSDDSVLYKSKSQKQLPSIPNISANTQSSFNFNCFNGLTCKSTYEAIKEPNSSFFVSCQPEPVYAEPFNFSQEIIRSEAIKNLKNEQKSASLYYMSTSLLRDEENGCLNMDENSNQQLFGDDSSVSSVLSEPDIALTEATAPETPKIKKLIDTFESKQTPNASKKDDHTQSEGSHRIDELKLCLQKTLDKCFEEEAKSPTQEVVDRIVNKFQTYVKTMPKYQKPKLSKDDRLFYCCLVVSWDGDKPQIKSRYPPNVKLPNRIEDLCYPEAASGPLDISNNAQSYSLVITDDKGERTFGYCRRVIPEGSTRCIPLAYCILSKHRAPRFYKKLLTELESRHGIPDKLRDELISKFYHNKFPRPGESVKVDLTNFCNDFPVPNTEKCQKTELTDSCDMSSFVLVDMNREYGTINVIKKMPFEEDVVHVEHDDVLCSPKSRNTTFELTLTLHPDTRYEEADLKPLHKLPSHILLKIFASLLLERKVILISCVISKLSSCVDALQSILYPFSWPHTFIPILPQCLWDVVESPTPLICGILSISVVNDHKIEHGIVVDLDEGSIISEEGDEDSILSDSLKKAWTEGIHLANSHPPDGYVHSVYLGDAYIKVFIAALKHYKNHIVNNSFEKEAFIRNAKTKGIRRFLKWFTETTLFSSFIDLVINTPESFSLFDQKIEMYGSDESNLIITKLYKWKKL